MRDLASGLIDEDASLPERVPPLEPAVQRLEGEALLCLRRLHRPAANLENMGTLHHPHCPGRVVQVVDVGHLSVACCLVECVVDRCSNGLDVVVGEKRPVWPLKSELKLEEAETTGRN